MRSGVLLLLAVMLFVMILSTGQWVSAGTVGDITVAPRWDKIWLAPRLTGNWVVLRYRGADLQAGAQKDNTLTAGYRSVHSTRGATGHGSRPVVLREETAMMINWPGAQHESP